MGELSNWKRTKKTEEKRGGRRVKLFKYVIVYIYLYVCMVSFSELPRFVVEPKDAIVLSGQDIRFDCEVEGSGGSSSGGGGGGNQNIRLTWKKEQREILSNTPRISFNHRTLIINNVTDSDEGLYTCVAQNVAGEITSKASLTVHSKYPSLRVRNYAY